MRSGEIIRMTREMNSSANTFRLNICFIRPSRVVIQESKISRFCFSFSYAYVNHERRQVQYLPRLAFPFQGSLTFILLLCEKFMKSLRRIGHVTNTLAKLIVIYSRLHFIVEMQPLVCFACLLQMCLRVRLSQEMRVTFFPLINCLGVCRG